MGSDQTTGERPQRKSVSSKLKRLAEDRARAAGELEVHLIAHKAIERAYVKQQAKLQLAKDKLLPSEKQRALLVGQLASFDEKIKAIDPKVNPRSIDCSQRYVNLDPEILEATRSNDCLLIHVDTSHNGV